VDNNCDGTVDEGCGCVAGDTRACGVSKGQCKQGTQTCSGGTWGQCVGEGTPVAEICDAVDNDCDGQTDEDLTRACSTIYGSGTETCSLGGYSSCTAPQPSAEICDGLDNDCDGTVDGANVVCADGKVCINGACQLSGPTATSGDTGCDCAVGHGTSVMVPLPLLLLALLSLVLRHRTT